MKKSQLYLYATAALLYSFDATASGEMVEEPGPSVSTASITADPIDSLKATVTEASRPGWYLMLADFLDGYSLSAPTKEEYDSLGNLVRMIKDGDEFQELVSNLGLMERLYVLTKENGSALSLLAFLSLSRTELGFRFLHEEIITCRNNMWKDILENERLVLQERAKKKGKNLVVSEPSPHTHPRDNLYNHMCANGLEKALMRVLKTYSQEVDSTQGFEVFLDEAFLTGDHTIRLGVLDSLGMAYVVHNISAENKSTIPLARLMRFNEGERADAILEQIAIRQATILQNLQGKAKLRFQEAVGKKKESSLSLSDVAQGQEGTLKAPIDTSELDEVLKDLKQSDASPEVQARGNSGVEQNDNNANQGEPEGGMNSTFPAVPVPAGDDAGSDDKGEEGKNDDTGVAGEVVATESKGKGFLSKLRGVGKKKNKGESEK